MSNGDVVINSGPRGFFWLRNGALLHHTQAAHVNFSNVHVILPDDSILVARYGNNSLVWLKDGLVVRDLSLPDTAWLDNKVRIRRSRTGNIILFGESGVVWLDADGNQLFPKLLMGGPTVGTFTGSIRNVSPELPDGSFLLQRSAAGYPHRTSIDFVRDGAFVEGMDRIPFPAPSRADPVVLPDGTLILGVDDWTGYTGNLYDSIHWYKDGRLLHSINASYLGASATSGDDVVVNDKCDINWYRDGVLLRTFPAKRITGNCPSSPAVLKDDTAVIVDFHGTVFWLR